MEGQVSIAQQRIIEARDLLSEIVGGSPGQRPWNPPAGVDMAEHKQKVVLLSSLDWMVAYIENNWERFKPTGGP